MKIVGVIAGLMMLSNIALADVIMPADVEARRECSRSVDKKTPLQIEVSVEEEVSRIVVRGVGCRMVNTDALIFSQDSDTLLDSTPTFRGIHISDATLQDIMIVGTDTPLAKVRIANRTGTLRGGYSAHISGSDIFVYRRAWEMTSSTLQVRANAADQWNINKVGDDLVIEIVAKPSGLKHMLRNLFNIELHPSYEITETPAPVSSVVVRER